MNKINNVAKRRAILVKGVHPSTYRLINTLTLPNDLELFALVTTHFNQKPSPIIRCFEFKNPKQRVSKTVSEFIAALRKKAEHYEYGTILDDILRDQLAHATTFFYRRL